MFAQLFSNLSSRKILLASMIGNALEFYDFTLYGVFTAVIANHYFPGEDETARLLSSLAAFAAGFFTRPLGAIFFGHLGDRMGRKEALSLSILLMGIPTLLIGISPDYQQIGIFASIMIFICRLMQGVFTGGEYNGAAIFSIEHMGMKHPGLVGGLITGSCAIGAFMATFLGSLTQREGMAEWAWRLPFILGAFISIVGYYMRRSITETPVFLASKLQPAPSRLPLLEALLRHPYSCLIAFTFGSFNGALTYTLFGFLNIYLSRYLDMPIVQAMQWNLLGLFTFMLGCPFMGYLLDRVGQRRFFIAVVFGILIISMPLFYAFSCQLSFALFLGQVALGLSAASIAGTAHAAMQKLFPVRDRYSGISFNFSLGMGLFGGITPIIYVQMIERHQMTLFFPAYFLMAMALIFGVVIYQAWRRLKVSYDS